MILLIIVVALVVPASAPAGRLLPRMPVSGGGDFSTSCGFSHRLSDDPIVYPAQPGRSHSHDFFGNRSTNAYSTYSSLRAAKTTCHRPLDAAPYWVPTLRQGTKVLQPNGSVAYYFTGAKDRTTVKPFPAGLRIIAGNGSATSPQPTAITSWSCTDSSTRSNSPPLCGKGRYLRLHVRFPDCWNGRSLDSFDHRSHMTYSGGGCPSSHPVGVPLLSLTITYPTAGGPGIAFSSGSRYTAHADYINAWHQPELTRLVRECINRGVRCGAR